MTKEEFIIYTKALIDLELENVKEEHYPNSVELVGILKLIQEALKSVDKHSYPNSNNTGTNDGISWTYNIIT
jgi:nitrate/nitrite-specific signal transduction histidine kinase